MAREIYEVNVTTFFLLGFRNTVPSNLFFFIFFLMIYCLTIFGNLLVIILVSISKTLHSPMYFFLSQLAIADIVLTTDIVPVMLNIVLHEGTFMSFTSCIIQYYFFALSGAADCFILTAMSYDRYLAICRPLHYATIMNKSLYIKLVFASWLLSCLLISALTPGLCMLHFCGKNTIDHFFCDLKPLLELSCSDVSLVLLESIFLSMPVVIFPFLLTVISYVNIILTILKISTASGRLKSFSTCSSHLAVVFIFFGTLFATYIIPNEGQSHMMSKLMAVQYTMITPFLNPFIYSLRNKDIGGALRTSVRSLQLIIERFA